MRVQQEFTLDRSRDEVWAFFHDIPAVAECFPGAEYKGRKDDGAHLGGIAMKVGPFQAAFEGEATADYDDDAHTVHMVGKGVDRKGGSRGKMTMDCAVRDDGGKSQIAVDADVQLSGAIAQFGRTGIIQEVANVLVSDFVKNVEQRMPASGPLPGSDQPTRADHQRPEASTSPQSVPIGGFRLFWLSLRGWFRSLFRSTG